MDDPEHQVDVNANAETSSEKEQTSEFELFSFDAETGPQMPPVSQSVVTKGVVPIPESVSDGNEKASIAPQVSPGVFDPAIHAVDASGRPIAKADGSGFRLKRGRKSTSKLDPKAKASHTPGQTPAPNFAEHGKTTAVLLTTVSSFVFGPEFQPTESDLAGLSQAFAEYYRVRGIKEMPPEVGIGVAVGLYVLPRWDAPKFVAMRNKLFGKKPEKKEEKKPDEKPIEQTTTPENPEKDQTYVRPFAFS